MSVSSLVLASSLVLPQPSPSPPPAAAAGSTLEMQASQVPREPHRPWVPRVIGVGVATLGAAAFASTVGLQYLDLRGQSVCTQGPGGPACLRNSRGLRAMGLLTFYGGSFTAGAMFGHARATTDLHLGRSRPSPRVGLALVAAPLAVASAKAIELTAIAVNGEKRCRAEARCRRRLMEAAYSVTNVSSVGLAVGLALIGYAIGEQRAWKRAEKITVSPSLSTEGGALQVSGRF